MRNYPFFSFLPQITQILHVLISRRYALSTFITTDSHSRLFKIYKLLILLKIEHILWFTSKYIYYDRCVSSYTDNSKSITSDKISEENSLFDCFIKIVFYFVWLLIGDPLTFEDAANFTISYELNFYYVFTLLNYFYTMGERQGSSKSNCEHSIFNVLSNHILFDIIEDAFVLVIVVWEVHCDWLFLNHIL